MNNEEKKESMEYSEGLIFSSESSRITSFPMLYED